MISIDEFTKALEAEFEDLTPGTLSPDTVFKSIKSWSSMHALIIIAFVDAQFDVLLTGADLKMALTANDLYNLVKEKRN